MLTQILIAKVRIFNDIRPFQVCLYRDMPEMAEYILQMPYPAAIGFEILFGELGYRLVKFPEYSDRAMCSRM